MPRHNNTSPDEFLTPSGRRTSPKSQETASISSSISNSTSFAYPRVTRDAPPSSFQGQQHHPTGLSVSAPTPGPLDRSLTSPIGLGTESFSGASSAYSNTSNPTISTPPTSLAHQSRLHPSSAISGGVTPNSSTLPKPSRRNTTGSSGPQTHSRSRSLNLPGSTPSDFAETSQSGARDDSLDFDILKEAEQIRRERNTKRARERAAAQAEAEAKLTAAHPSVARAPEHGASVVTTERELEDHVPIGGGIHVPKMDEDKVLVGNLIGEDHVNYVLMYNMLTGIRIGVSFFCFTLDEVGYQLVWISCGLPLLFSLI